jgi:beta-lactamase regulating signal transducer with metallopeptidase domain
MNSELLAIDWLGRGWLLVLAFTSSVLIVAALRRACRRLFGAERAFQLWLLPPLAMLASQLPHAAATTIVAWSPVVSAITSRASAAPAHAAEAVSSSWRAWTMLLWLLGSLVTLSLAAIAQWRYLMRLRGAIHVTDARSGWPTLRAPGADIGPALIGAWRSRIVLPADFERRYDTTEQMLILAHEAIHARRHDGWWCLLAQLAAALFWFHPLAWWALAALRHDQEMACDAAVLREHGEHRRSYANAMLKTQSATFALPVGCAWSPRHPLTERIAMLKLPRPGRVRRSIGMITGLSLAAVTMGSVYAASTPPDSHMTTKASAATSGRLQLVRLVARNQPVRAAAVSLAARSGMTLVNPEALTNTLITSMDFDEIPVELAMKMFADISDKEAVFEGNQVRFEKK